MVIAVCALAAKEVFYLNWWSVVRDCTCYLISIIVLLCTIANEVVSWPEALFFLLLYVVYCVAMAFNSKIEAVVKARVRVPESWNVTQPGPAVPTSEPAVENAADPYGRMNVKVNGNDAFFLCGREIATSTSK